MKMLTNQQVCHRTKHYVLTLEKLYHNMTDVLKKSKDYFICTCSQSGFNKKKIIISMVTKVEWFNVKC